MESFEIFAKYAPKRKRRNAISTNELTYIHKSSAEIAGFSKKNGITTANPPTAGETPLISEATQEAYRSAFLSQGFFLTCFYQRNWR